MFKEQIGKKINEIEIGQYRHIFVQSRQDYDKMLHQANSTIKKFAEIKKKEEEGNLISKITEIFAGSGTGAIGKTALQYIEKIKERGFFLLQKWHSVEGGQSNYRIVCIPNSLHHSLGAFYVYFNDYIHEKDKNSFSYLENASQVKDLLVLPYMSQKHKKKLQELSSKYEERTKSKLRTYSIINILSEQYVPKIKKKI